MEASELLRRDPVTGKLTDAGSTDARTTTIKVGPVAAESVTGVSVVIYN